MKKIARVVVRDSKGRFLAVHQRGHRSYVAFPGGHVERGETPEAAAARELEEETGLRATKLQLLCRVLGDKRDTWVYLAEAKGKVRSSDEGKAAWRSEDDFLSGKYGSFSEAVFGCLRRLKSA